MAVDADGDALVVWERINDVESHQIRARSRSAAGVLGRRIEALSTPGLDSRNPQVAVDADGDALVVWVSGGHRGRINARARSAAGVLGPIYNLSAFGYEAFNPQVAIDAEGDALVVWSIEDEDDGRVWVQARAWSTARGEFGPTATISTAGNRATRPKVAVDADGDALVVWNIYDSYYRTSRIQARGRHRNGAWGPTHNVSASGEYAVEPEVVIDADGDALVVWDGHEHGVRARAVFGVGIITGPIRTISGPTHGAVLPKVAINARGDAVVVWWDYLSGKLPYHLNARTLSFPRSLLGETQLIARGYDLGGHQIAGNRDGDAVVVWQERNRFGRREIHARVRSAAGALGGIWSWTGEIARDAHSLQVAVDADGDSLVVWVYRDPPEITRVEAAAGP